jgi:hypothetical protein
MIFKNAKQYGVFTKKSKNRPTKQYRDTTSGQISEGMLAKMQ